MRASTPTAGALSCDAVPSNSISSAQMDPRISIITLGVSDLQRSTHFYREGLALPMRESEGDVAFFETSATWLSLFPNEKLVEDVGVSPKGEGFPGFTLAHDVSSREKVDEFIEQAIAAGAEVANQPR